MIRSPVNPVKIAVLLIHDQVSLAGDGGGPDVRLVRHLGHTCSVTGHCEQFRRAVPVVAGKVTIVDEDDPLSVVADRNVAAQSGFQRQGQLTQVGPVGVDGEQLEKQGRVLCGKIAVGDEQYRAAVSGQHRFIDIAAGRMIGQLDHRSAVGIGQEQLGTTVGVEAERIGGGTEQDCGAVIADGNHGRIRIEGGHLDRIGPRQCFPEDLHNRTGVCSQRIDVGNEEHHASCVINGGVTLEMVTPHKGGKLSDDLSGGRRNEHHECDTKDREAHGEYSLTVASPAYSAASLHTS